MDVLQLILGLALCGVGGIMVVGELFVLQPSIAVALLGFCAAMAGLLFLEDLRERRAGL